MSCELRVFSKLHWFFSGQWSVIVDLPHSTLIVISKIRGPDKGSAGSVSMQLTVKHFVQSITKLWSADSTLNLLKTISFFNFVHDVHDYLIIFHAVDLLFPHYVHSPLTPIIHHSSLDSYQFYDFLFRITDVYNYFLKL